LREAEIKAQTAQATIQDKVAERASREKIENMKIVQDHIKLQNEMTIHAHDAAHDMAAKQQDMQLKHSTHQMDLQHEAASAQVNQQAEAMKQHGQIQMEGHKHQAEMARDAQKHTQEMQHERESHAVQLETDKKMGEAQAKAIGPAEKANVEGKTKNEGQAHKQKLDHNDQRMGMEKEKHKVELTNSKKMTDAKVTATKKSAKNKVKPKKDSE